MSLIFKDLHGPVSIYLSWTSSGPVLRAEEGDLIRVVFKNEASRPYSVQAHGVQYTIDQEGTLYSDRYQGLWFLKDNEDYSVALKSTSFLLFFFLLWLHTGNQLLKVKEKKQNEFHIYASQRANVPTL